jgi:hypothetical protein
MRRWMLCGRGDAGHQRQRIFTRQGKVTVAAGRRQS